MTSLGTIATTAAWWSTAIGWTVNTVLVVVFVLCALSLLYLAAVVVARAYQRVFRR